MRAIDPMGEAAALCDAAADELDRGAQHCRTAAAHFREKDVPRAAAHAWAAMGHVRLAEEALDTQAQTHAQNSMP